MASGVKCVNTWLNAINLTVDISKTEYILITSKEKQNHLPQIPSPTINGAPIKKDPVTKSLGLFIDENFSWDTHVKKDSKTIAAGIGAIKRMKHFVPHSTLLTIFNSLVQPNFHFCNVVWGNCSKGLCDKLQKNSESRNPCPIRCIF